MPQPSKTQCIGILTSGGDCPGLNAAIRAIAKPALNEFGIKIIGFIDGFRGLVENRYRLLSDADVSGILTVGGTILGTSRDKPHKMTMGNQVMDMTEVAIANAKKLQIDCLVCLGGGGTQKNALHLHQVDPSFHVLTLPKTIDNDVAGTELTFGFDTAVQIASEAIDRLHTTATSHHRIIILEIMGHNSGWLALAAGLAGGADVILIPEIPYSIDKVISHLKDRRQRGKRFSIIAIAEGARSQEELEQFEKAQKGKKKKKKVLNAQSDSVAHRLAHQLQEKAGLETRVTALGHVQRGGTPSATDRLLCTRLGTKACELLVEGVYDVMVAVRNGECVPVPLTEVAGHKKLVPPDHEWIRAARLTGTCLGN
ncbi:MAG: 6-phosphofructokinase [Lentisphaerae bacterium]|nr:MAG: 6-phosphofructokinase [Lentisphaerota bacterium]